MTVLPIVKDIFFANVKIFKMLTIPILPLVMGWLHILGPGSVMFSLRPKPDTIRIRYFDAIDVTRYNQMPLSYQSHPYKDFFSLVKLRYLFLVLLCLIPW
mgnify:CR=1 FL=1